MKWIFILTLLSGFAENTYSQLAKIPSKAGVKLVNGYTNTAFRVYRSKIIDGKACRLGCPTCSPGQTLPDKANRISSAALEPIRRHEQQFFKDLADDQIMKTQCEQQYLKALDIFSNVPERPQGRDPKESIEHALQMVQEDNAGKVKPDLKALALQKTILSDFYDRFSILDEAVKKARGASSNDRIYIGKNPTAAQVQRQQKADRDNEKATNEEAMVRSSFWNASDENVSSFVDQWSRLVRNNHLTREQFLKLATDTDRSDSFQQSVVRKMQLRANDRVAKIKNINWLKDPSQMGTFELLRLNDQKKRFMEEEVALPFLTSNPKYKDDAEGMACFLEGNYGNGRKIVYWSGQAVLLVVPLALNKYIKATEGTIALLSNNAKLPQILRTAVLVGGYTADVADAYLSQCINPDGAESAQQAPVCQQMAQTKEFNDQVQLINSEMNGRSCASSMALAALGGGALAYRLSQLRPVNIELLQDAFDAKVAAGARFTNAENISQLSETTSPSIQKFEKLAKPLSEDPLFEENNSLPMWASGIKSGRTLNTKILTPEELGYANSVRSPLVSDVSKLQVTPLNKIPIIKEMEVSDIMLHADGTATRKISRLGSMDGRPVIVQSIHYLDPSMDSKLRTLKEAQGVKLYSDLGVGPKFHGVFFDPKLKSWCIVADIIPGAKDAPVSQRTFKDLETILERMEKAGMTGQTTETMGSVDGEIIQTLRTREGRLQAVDAEGARESILIQSKNDPLNPASKFVETRKLLLMDAQTDPHLGVEYLDNLKNEKPLVWKSLMVTMKTATSGTASNPLMSEKYRVYGEYLLRNQIQ